MQQMVPASACMKNTVREGAMAQVQGRWLLPFQLVQHAWHRHISNHEWFRQMPPGAAQKRTPGIAER